MQEISKIFFDFTNLPATKITNTLSKQKSDLFDYKYKNKVSFYRPFLWYNRLSKKFSHDFSFRRDIALTELDGAALIFSINFQKNRSDFVAQLPITNYISLMKHNFPKDPKFKNDTNDIIKNFQADNDTLKISPPKNLFAIKYWPTTESILLPQIYFENLDFEENSNNSNPFLDEKDKQRCLILRKSVVGVSKYIDGQTSELRTYEKFGIKGFMLQAKE